MMLAAEIAFYTGCVIFGIWWPLIYLGIKKRLPKEQYEKASAIALVLITSGASLLAAIITGVIIFGLCGIVRIFL